MCGVPDLPLYDGQSPAQRISNEIFEDDFITCKSISKDELYDSLVSYSKLTAANGRITLNPLIKKRLLAMVEWANGMYCVGQDPIARPFPVHETNAIIEKGKELKKYKDKAKTIIEAAKPATFTNKLDWLDWSETFKNFMKHIPGRSEVPLLYILRENVNQAMVEDPTKDLIHNLIEMAPLYGEAYDTDASEVHTYIFKFIECNVTAEAKIRSHPHQGNGRYDFMSLKDHYEGVGFHAIAVTKAEETISTMYYSGEKYGMNWEKFERELNLAWATMDKQEGRMVYSDERKIRILFTKVKSADFLKTMCTTLESQILNPAHGITYEQCMTAFRNEVRKKFPHESTTTTRSRRVQQVGKGRGGGRRRGRWGQRNSGNAKRKSHPNERMVKGKSGRWLAVHASYKLDKDVCIDLPDAEKRKINEERAIYKRSRGGNDNTSVVSQITTDTSGMATIQVPIAMLQQASTATSTQGNDDVSQQQHINISPMGGRNEQSQLRSRNNGIS